MEKGKVVITPIRNIPKSGTHKGDERRLVEELLSFRSLGRRREFSCQHSIWQ